MQDASWDLEVHADLIYCEMPCPYPLQARDVLQREQLEDLRAGRRLREHRDRLRAVGRQEGTVLREVRKINALLADRAFLGPGRQADIL